MFNGKLIMYLRKQRQLSQQDLADKLSVTRGTVSNWEIGRRTPDVVTLIALSDLFGVSMDLFVERYPEQTAREICGLIDAFLNDREIDKKDKEKLIASISKQFEKHKKKK